MRIYLSKRRSAWFVLLAALCVPSIVFTQADTAVQAGTIAIVYADTAPIFDSAGAERTMIRAVVQGATYPLVKTITPPRRFGAQADDDWVQVTMFGGRSGYIPARYVEVLPPGKFAEKLYRATVKPPSPYAPVTSTAGLSSGSSAATAGSPAVIERKCREDWNDDFRMQVACQNQQTEAVTALQTRAMQTTDQRTIRSKCATDWPDDFRMRDACEQQQLKALQQLGR